MGCISQKNRGKSGNYWVFVKIRKRLHRRKMLFEQKSFHWYASVDVCICLYMYISARLLKYKLVISTNIGECVHYFYSWYCILCEKKLY